MNAMPSFDVVSKLDLHELTNALDQANRELANRFDFKGTGAEFERSAETVVTLNAKAEFQLKQMLDILKQRLAGRHIDIRCADIADPEINLASARQQVTLKQGIDQPLAKDIVKRIKDARLKVEAQIQGDKLRISGKKRDDLQTAIALLRTADLNMPLQFENFRD
jgi:cyclic-di-GMP-binding protein